MTDDVSPAPSIEPPQTSSPRSPQRMGRRERRRKIITLLVLLALLALLAYVAYYYLQNRSLPIPGIAPAGEVLQPPNYLFSITGSGSNTLNTPVGVTVGNNRRVYVVDFGKRRISVFSPSGAFLFSFNKVTDGTYTQLGNPIHLATGTDGNIWVTDRRNKAVYIFSPQGEFVRKFVPDGNKNFSWTPLAIAIAEDGSVRITDVGNTAKHRVLYFDPKGKLTAQVGETAQVDSPDQSPGSFYFPNGLAIAKDGSVYVSDGDNRRVQVFDGAAKFKQFLRTSGIPRGEAIDEESRLLVVDALAHQIDVYNLQGEQLTQFGQQGFGPGQFNYPNDVAVRANRIYITDRQNDQVQVWGWPVAALPPLAPPKTPLGWLLCLSPLLLLPLLLLLRRRRFTVTEDFVDAMVAAGETQIFAERRFRFVVPEGEHYRYEGRIEDGVDLGERIEAEPHSPSDAQAIQGRLEVGEELSIILAVAQRSKGLCTQDEELRRVALMLEIYVYDKDAFLERFRSKKG